MSTSATLEVKGIKEALRDLNTIGKKLRRSLTVEYKEIVYPMVQEAISLVPSKAPMSGFDRQWVPRSNGALYATPGKEQVLPWSFRAGQIKPFLSGKRPRTTSFGTSNLATFGVRWMGKGAVLFDTASHSSTPQGAQMTKTLNARFGGPSRVMWRAYEHTSLDIQHELRQLVEKIMRAVGREIKVRP